MLLAASQLAARSVYVCGNTSSTTGLTVTLTREERGESGIEAGALVLSDQGLCAIDELDKMQKNHLDGEFVLGMFTCKDVAVSASDFPGRSAGGNGTTTSVDRKSMRCCITARTLQCDCCGQPSTRQLQHEQDCS